MSWKEELHGHLGRCRKAFDKIQNLFLIKTQQTRKRTALTRKKGIYEKSAANIIFNVKRINVFLLIRKKGRVSAFITSIRYSTGSCIQWNKAEKN